MDQNVNPYAQSLTVISAKIKINALNAEIIFRFLLIRLLVIILKNAQSIFVNLASNLEMSANLAIFPLNLVKMAYLVFAPKGKVLILILLVPIAFQIVINVSIHK